MPAVYSMSPVVIPQMEEVIMQGLGVPQRAFGLSHRHPLKGSSEQERKKVRFMG